MAELIAIYGAAKTSVSRKRETGRVAFLTAGVSKMVVYEAEEGSTDEWTSNLYQLFA
jgi:hypothetical protein